MFFLIFYFSSLEIAYQVQPQLIMTFLSWISRVRPDG